MPSQKQIPDEQPSLSTSKAFARQLTATGEQLNATNVDFLKIDVETALTFTGLALETDNEEKKQRNRKNARKAYDAILRLWGNVTFTPSEEAHMHEKMGILKNDLELLGEKF
jgi:hypothetical protein